MAALIETAESVFNAPSPSLDLAGSTDLGILQNMLDHYGRDFHPSERDEFFLRYHGYLRSNLCSGKYPACILPGVAECLERCRAEGVATGLLTGNTRIGALIKMTHFGLNDYFPFGAYGDDFADRNLLGPVALARAGVFHQRAFSASRTLVVGDTPKDINCARAMGAHCLAVATGRFSADTCARTALISLGRVCCFDPSRTGLCWEISIGGFHPIWHINCSVARDRNARFS